MTNFSNENRRGYMIRSTSTNNISGISGTNLKDMILLETVAPVSTSAASTSASATAPSATKGEGKQSSGPRPRRKKMVAIGVDAMKKMIVTSSSTAVALPDSPTVMVSRKHEGEQRDDTESVFNNIRSASTRKVLAFDLSAPTMHDTAEEELRAGMLSGVAKEDMLPVVAIPRLSCPTRCGLV